MKKNRLTKKRNLKNMLLRSFLIISIICCVFLVSNCDQLLDLFGPGNGGGPPNPPGLGGSESSSLSIGSLFESVAKGAAGQVGSDATGWIFGALGLSNGSPDYNDELSGINEKLSVIIGQLKDISNELNQINGDLNKINCTEWVSTYTEGTSQINNLLDVYNTYVNSVYYDSAKISNDSLTLWATQVLNGTSNTKSIQSYLGEMEVSLLDVGGNTGTLPSCLANIDIPVDHSFNTDSIYYHQVYTWVNYFYLYQVEALFLYSEAEHYMAWKQYDANNTNLPSADDVAEVCKDKNIITICNLVASQTNSLYNNLIAQFTAAGAPFSDDMLIAEYRAPTTSGPFLWPRSLEDFSHAAYNQGLQSVDCSSPLTSNSPCGVTANLYNQGGDNLSKVVYDSYSGWGKAGTAALQQLLDGWYSGTAGEYLKNRYHFKNMNNKIIMSQDAQYITLYPTSENININIAPFFDTDINYSLFQGVISTSSQFQSLAQYWTSDARHCSSGYPAYINHYWKSNTNVPFSRNNFYDITAAENGYVNYLDEIIWCNSFNFSTTPGWYTGNKGSSAVQYQWPVLPVSHIPCTDGRSNLNIVGVWTKCGDDFTKFLNDNIQRPATCDELGAGTQCIATL